MEKFRKKYQNVIKQVEAKKLRIFKGRSSKGIKGIQLQDNDKVISVSILDNSIVKDYFKTRRGPHLSKTKTETYLETLINTFSIKAPDSKAEISTLSGGNMQKLLMGRELISKPEVIIASQPTRGLDVNAVDAIHNLLADQRDGGSAILLISKKTLIFPP